MLAAAADAVVVAGPASAVTSAFEEAPGLAQSGSPYAPLISPLRLAFGALGEKWRMKATQRAGGRGSRDQANAIISIIAHDDENEMLQDTCSRIIG